MDNELYFDEDQRPIPVEWHESMREEEMETAIPGPFPAWPVLRFLLTPQENKQQLADDLIALAHFLNPEATQPLSQAEIARRMNENPMTTCRRFKRWRKRGLNI